MTPEEKAAYRELRAQAMAWLVRAKPGETAASAVVQAMQIVDLADRQLDPAAHYLKQRADAEAALQDLCVPH